MPLSLAIGRESLTVMLGCHRRLLRHRATLVFWVYNKEAECENLAELIIAKQGNGRTSPIRNRRASPLSIGCSAT